MTRISPLVALDESIEFLCISMGNIALNHLHFHIMDIPTWLSMCENCGMTVHSTLEYLNIWFPRQNLGFSNCWTYVHSFSCQILRVQHCMAVAGDTSCQFWILKRISVHTSHCPPMLTTYWVAVYKLDTFVYCCLLLLSCCVWHIM